MNLTATDKRNLITGAVIAAVIAVLALNNLRGDGILGDTGGTVRAPGLGLATVGQLALSALIGLGAFAWKIGKELRGKLLNIVKPPAETVQAVPDDELTRLEAVVLERLRVGDADGVVSTCDLYRRIQAENTAKTTATP